MASYHPSHTGDSRCYVCGLFLNHDPGPTCGLCTAKREADAALAMPQGWMCGRCGTVHAPFVRQCECSPPSVGGTTIHMKAQ